MRYKKILICILFLCIVSITVYADETLTVLKKLQSNMGNLDTLSTEFSQIKNLSFLNQRLEIKGRLYLDKPDRFVWQVDSPLEYKMMINGSDMYQWDGDTGRTRRISLADDPVFKAAFSQIRLWFSGDYLSMSNDYDISVISQQPVELRFIPLSGSGPEEYMTEVIVTFRADQRYIESIEIREKSGDSMTLKFVNTLINNDIDEQVWRL